MLSTIATVRRSAAFLSAAALWPKICLISGRKCHELPEISRESRLLVRNEWSWNRQEWLSDARPWIGCPTARRFSSEMGDADFGDLSVQRVTEADFDDAIKFLKTDFLHNEPLNRSLNMTEEDTEGLFDNLVRAGIASSLSYALRTRGGQIAALRLVSILDRPDNEQRSKEGGAPAWNSTVSNDNNNTIATAASKLSPKAQIISNVLEELENKVWILINPRLKRLLLWSIISVDKNFTRRGLAGKLLNYNLDEARLMGCQACVTEASAFKSQQLFKKLGYELLHEVKHAEWLDERGQQIFRCDDGTDSIQLAYKPL